MIDFDPYGDAFLDDPHVVYARLREESPVHFVERFGATFLSRFDDVWAATQSRKLSVAGGITPSQLLLGAPANPKMPSQMDPPRHTAMRSVLSPHFRPGAVARLEGEIRALARARIEAALPTGRLDVAAELGAPISAHVACRVVGFPIERASALSQRVNAFFHRRAGQRGETEKAAEAAAALYAWVGDFVAGLRAEPARATGIAADLIACRVEGRALDDDDLVHAVVNLLIAASDSFPKALAGAVARLAEAPDQRRAVVADPGLVPGAFLESVRIDTPTQFQGRTVLEPIEFGGRTLRSGERVCFLFPAANRDPREFDAPDRFDIRRNPPRTLAFGNGIHLCLGRPLALLEARIALEELLARIPEYAPIPDEARFARTEYVRGWLRYPIEFERAMP
ncbi:MAG: cytochrome P450 [Deltaproteobacteria bacterium]|nr:cytochrome P450 [Deltaproteobacteria bacterium]